ncbi:MAG: anti-sigma-factor antagonist [Chthoniobacteraceae bacterium]|nr:anti-sigma-factor antagonist [Chthoniobacteraceae bacterium]
MEFSNHDQSHYSVLVISGEIDLLEAPKLRLLLEAKNGVNHPVLILDISEVSFVDSSGLSELIRYQHAAREQGRSFFIAGARAEIMELFSIAGLGQFFRLYNSFEDALAAACI